MNYLLHLLIYIDIYIIVALSLNLVVGYCGLLTLAQAGYFAVGAYTYALLTLNLDWGFIPASLAGGLISALLSLAVSLSSWRLKNDFFVLVTLAIQALILSVLYNWYSTEAPLGSWTNLTNGPYGINGVPRPSLFGFELSSIAQIAGLATVMTLISGFIFWKLQIVLHWERKNVITDEESQQAKQQDNDILVARPSPWARLLMAMRDDELAARGLGKNTRWIKVEAIAISAFFVAIAGALYASNADYIDHEIALLDESILMLSMVIVGGLGNFKGPVVGAAFLVLLPEALRFFPLPDVQAANLRMLIYGLLLVLMMHWRPQGFAGTYRME